MWVVIPLSDLLLEAIPYQVEILLLLFAATEHGPYSLHATLKTTLPDVFVDVLFVRLQWTLRCLSTSGSRGELAFTRAAVSLSSRGITARDIKTVVFGGAFDLTNAMRIAKKACSYSRRDAPEVRLSCAERAASHSRSRRCPSWRDVARLAVSATSVS